VCQQLADIRSTLSAFAADYVAVRLGPGEAEKVLKDATAIEAMASTLKALTAAFLAENGHWWGSGQSDADALARATGSSTSSAKDAIDTGRRLETQPKVARAARNGELSSAQTSLIANATEANPDAADRLLDKAKTSTVAELKDDCARVKAAAEPDPEERYRRIHAGRDLRSYTDVEGIWHLHARGTSVAGAQIMAALEPIADRFFHEARRADRIEPPGAYGFDALVELAMAATSAEQSCEENPRRKGAAVKLLLRLDYQAFLRGIALEGETCELAGYGPVPMSVVHELLETGDPFVAAILTKAKALVGVAHLGRKPTAHQQSALEWLYPSCAAEGCTARAHLERDHRIDWAKSHITKFEWLDLLCRREHDLKTRYGWALVEGTGKRPFVPPDDARHPEYKRRSGAA
jgi:hypothetical protein